MKKVTAFFLVSLFSVATLVPFSADAATCNVRLRKVDDSTVISSCKTVSRKRVRNWQRANVTNNTVIAAGNGGNTFIVGQDAKNLSITLGQVVITNNVSSTVNRATITIN